MLYLLVSLHFLIFGGLESYNPVPVCNGIAGIFKNYDSYNNARFDDSVCLDSKGNKNIIVSPLALVGAVVCIVPLVLKSSDNKYKKAIQIFNK